MLAKVEEEQPGAGLLEEGIVPETAITVQGIVLSYSGRRNGAWRYKRRCVWKQGRRD